MSKRVWPGWKRDHEGGWTNPRCGGVAAQGKTYTGFFPCGILRDADLRTPWRTRRSGWFVQIGTHSFGTFNRLRNAQLWMQKNLRVRETPAEARRWMRAWRAMP
jgi:hypothetical protein